MTAKHDLERRVADFYATEAPLRAPDRVLEQALATIDHTRQRRELGLVSWRSRTMNPYLKLAAAAVLGVAVAALGLNLLPRSPGGSVGGAPSASPPPSPSSSPAASPSQSASPSASPGLTPAPLTSTYTSEIHGLSVQYPAEWMAVPATEDDATVDVDYLAAGNDFLHDPVRGDHLFLALGSYPLDDGQAGEAWAAAEMGADADCTTAPQSITVDGAPALICGQLVLTWAGDRGYSVRLYASDDGGTGLRDAYDRAWFEEVLESVQLPAEDAAGASPSG